MVFAVFCPGPPGRLSALSVFLCKSVSYGVFVWARRALNSQKRRSPARADGALYCAVGALWRYPTMMEWSVVGGRAANPGGPRRPAGALGLAIAQESYPLLIEFPWVLMEITYLWPPLTERELSPQVGVAHLAVSHLAAARKNRQ